MSIPRSYQVEAVIIKKTRLGEADTILTLYTPGMGKIQGFAKSLRKTKSKMAGHLELLTHSQVSLARGRNIDTVTGSQTIASFLPLKTDLELTSYALYITELVGLFTADHIENRPLFQLLVDTLHQLCQDCDRQLILRYFEIHLLDMVGYRPQMGQCGACHIPLQPQTNYFSPRAGGVLCPECQDTQPLTYALSVDALKVLRWLQTNRYEALGRLKIKAILARELEMIIRDYLRFLLERDVKSAAWLDTLRSNP